MKTLAWPRFVISVLLLLAIGIVLHFLLATRPDFSTLRFFWYFTNQSNILVALFYILQSFMVLPRPVQDRIRGALVLYMSMTSSIYWLFLHRLVHLDSTPAYLSNVFLHSGALAFLIYDLWRDRPQTKIRKSFVAVWMIYPALYVGGIMIMGQLQHWYPYPFLNIGTLGFEKWLLWISGMASAIVASALGIIGIQNRLAEVFSR